MLLGTSLLDWTLHASTPALATIGIVAILAQLLLCTNRLVHHSAAMVSVRLPECRLERMSLRVSVSQTITRALGALGVPAICAHIGSIPYVGVAVQPLLQCLLQHPPSQPLLQVCARLCCFLAPLATSCVVEAC